MQTRTQIDYARLFGFDALSDQLSTGVDFQNEVFEAKLGAKVGAETLVALDLADNEPASQYARDLIARVRCFGKENV